MWEKIKKLTDITLIAGFLGFIYLVLVMTYTGPVQKAVEDTKFTFASYENLSKKFEGILQKNLYKKYGFINLSGRIARILRINSLNRVQKLANGFLTNFSQVSEIDVKEDAKSIIELNNFFEYKNIPFLYLLIPDKNSIYDVKFAPGYEEKARQHFVNMANLLGATNVSIINMDSWFENNGWHMEDVFWKTDHHWKPQAGLATARCTMELLHKKGIVEYDEEKLQEKSYKVKILKNWFLGSRGKRTGMYYAGVDDISVYFPKFKTDYSNIGLHTNTRDWRYSKELIDSKYLKRKDFFGTDPYSIYLSQGLQIQITTNSIAPNKRRLLLIADSFRKVLQYFMATQFQEIYAIDLRDYTDGSFMQYVTEISPDIIIMCTEFESWSDRRMYQFGLKEYLRTLEKPSGFIMDLGNIEFQAEEKNNNKFEIVCSNLEPNQTYTLTIDRTELSGVKNSFVQMALQNISENKAVYNRYFDANSGKTQKWIFTTPENTEDTYGIYLYAGTKGHTAKIGVKVEGIKLQKGIYEG